MPRRRALTVVAAAIAVAVATTGVVADPTGAARRAAPQPVTPNDGSREPAIAAGDGRTLVVWVQPGGGSSYAHLWGRVVPGSGPAGDPFPITTDEAVVEAPDVAWNGSSWLVVWSDRSNPLVVGGIRGRRISATGALLGAELPLATRSSGQLEPAVAAGPAGQFHVVWTVIQEPSVPSDVYGRRVAADGRLLDGSAGRRLSIDDDADPTRDSQPDIAWNGTNYLVVWAADRFVHDGLAATQISASGAKAAVGLLTQASRAGADRAPSVASDGRSLVVVFERWTTSGDPADGIALRGLQLEADMTRTSFPVLPQSGGGSAPSVACNGLYVVAWVARDPDRQVSVVRTARIRDARVLDPGGTAASPAGVFAAYPVLTAQDEARSFVAGWAESPPSQQSAIAIRTVQVAPK